MQPRSSADILATAKFKPKRKKPTVSAYRGQIISFSESPPSLQVGNSQSSSPASPVATIEHNENHPFLGHNVFPPEFTFHFESPTTSDNFQQDSFQQDSSAAESDTMLAHPVLKNFLS